MSAEKLREMRTELEIHRGLTHPGIVKVEDVFETPEALYMVLEKLTGGELYDRVLKRGPLTEVAAANVSLQILEALSCMHSSGVMHSDIKLDNILYEQNSGDSVKLIDFGYASKLNSGHNKKKCGTLHYVAPEVLSGDIYDERADMWSMGSVLFAMLTGSTLFRGTERQVYEKNSVGKVDYNNAFKRLSTDAQELVQWFLNVDPAGRPSASQAMQHPFFRRTSFRRPEPTATTCKEASATARFLGPCVGHIAQATMGAMRRRSIALGSAALQDIAKVCNLNECLVLGFQPL